MISWDEAPLSANRVEALPGWSWDPHSDSWEEGFTHLKKFSEREGHCRVPYGHKTDTDYRLSIWVFTQRRKKDTMDPDRRQRLEALPGWSWDILSDQWEEGFTHLKKFSEHEGHCRVPQSYKTDADYSLGVWVGRQRRSKDEMDPDYRQRLEALPGWIWNVLSDKWEQGFSCLKKFSDREGHCRVAHNHKTEDDYQLGAWVKEQRATKDKMDPVRRKRLEALPGWVWKVRE